MTPQTGDIWLWCEEVYLLVLDYDPHRKLYQCMRLYNGETSDWEMLTDDPEVCVDWEFIV